ncbi:MAG: PEGA domain-containing protein [Sandaracinaceae bacterium]|nr:PEGA domain-containing protein [Sandaracinaceae bacterium]
MLTLTGVPDGARVTVDGEDVSGSRVELAPSDAQRTIEVRLDGHRTWRRTVTGDASHELAVALAREEQRAAQTQRASTQRASTQRASTQRASTQRASTQRASTQRPTKQRAGRPGSRPTAVTNPGF